MMSGLLPDAQISASSSRDVMWSPGSARLVASRSGWFPGPTQPLSGEEWLQVRRRIVTGGKLSHFEYLGGVVSSSTKI